MKASSKIYVACLAVLVVTMVGELIGAALAIFMLGDQYAIPLSTFFGLVALLVAIRVLKSKGVDMPIIGEKFTWLKFAGWMAITIVIVLVQFSYVSISNSPPEADMIESSNALQGYSLLLQIAVVISIAITGPIIEEVIFRHVIVYPFLNGRSRIRVLLGFALSVSLFVLAHTQYKMSSSVVFLMLFAVVLTLARFSTKGLATPVLMHVLVNTIACYELVTYSAA